MITLFNPVLTGLNNGWGGIIDDSYFWNFKMLRTFLENTSLELSYGVPDIYKEHPLAISIREDGKNYIWISAKFSRSRKRI